MLSLLVWRILFMLLGRAKFWENEWKGGGCGVYFMCVCGWREEKNVSMWYLVGAMLLVSPVWNLSFVQSDVTVSVCVLELTQEVTVLTSSLLGFLTTNIIEISLRSWRHLACNTVTFWSSFSEHLYYDVNMLGVNKVVEGCHHCTFDRSINAVCPVKEGLADLALRTLINGRWRLTCDPTFTSRNDREGTHPTPLTPVDLSSSTHVTVVLKISVLKCIVEKCWTKHLTTYFFLVARGHCLWFYTNLECWWYSYIILNVAHFS